MTFFAVFAKHIFYINPPPFQKGGGLTILKLYRTCLISWLLCVI